MEKKQLTLGYIIVILLLLNTFFVAGIWSSVKIACGHSGKNWCPFSKNSTPKMCPLTGKMMGSQSAEQTPPAVSK